jgi:hypothetical protein
VCGHAARRMTQDEIVRRVMADSGLAAEPAQEGL